MIQTMFNKIINMLVSFTEASIRHVLDFVMSVYAQVLNSQKLNEIFKGEIRLDYGKHHNPFINRIMLYDNRIINNRDLKTHIS